MLRWIAILSLIAVTHVSALGTVCAVEVVLQDEVLVTGDTLRLSQLATIRDNDPEVVTHLGELLIAPAPKTARPVTITFDQIRDRLEVLGVNLATVEFSGTTKVVVRVKGVAAAKAAVIQQVSAKVAPADVEELKQKVIDAFLKGFRSNEASFERYEIEIDIPVSSERLVQESDPATWYFAEAALAIGVDQPLLMVVDRRDGQPVKVPLKISIVEKVRVLALRHPVPKGYVLQATDVVWAPATQETEGIVQLADALGKETKKGLKAGTRLEAKDLASVPLIRPNDIVTAMVRSPGLLVKKQFKSAGSGAMGEVVTLVSLEDPRSKVQAQVTGYHEAEVLVLKGAVGASGEAAGSIRFEAADRAESPSVTAPPLVPTRGRAQ
jgi:flagella basal body P-ring formation protein FlgA